MAIHICRQCGQEFYRKGRGPAFFCNNRCQGLSRVGKPSPHRLAQGNSFGKGGFRPDLGIYCRSRWEANYARYLRSLKISFIYEPEKAGFLIQLPDGTEHSYRPDFLVNNAYYIEIKGWERPDRRQAEVIEAAQYQLPLPLYIIRSSQYKQLERTMASKIDKWEYKGDNLPPKPNKFCPVCGKHITAISRRTKFCSIKCYAAYRPKAALKAFIKGGERTRFEVGLILGAVGGKASAEARHKRKTLM